MKRNKTAWQPLRQANLVRKLNDEDIALAMKLGKYEDPEEARRYLEAEIYGATYWVNDLYQVARHVIPPEKSALKVEMIHLNIRRRDGKPIFRDWRHFQQIKNELVGEECEGAELYPAESRLSDTSNKYHIFCFTNPECRFPFGMTGRAVLDDEGDRTPGHRQRRL